MVDVDRLANNYKNCFPHCNMFGFSSVDLVWVASGNVVLDQPSVGDAILELYELSPK